MPVPWRMMLLVFACATALNLGPVARPQAASASPSLKETTDWLVAHLVGVYHASRQTVVNYHAKKGKDPQEVDRQVTNTRDSVTSAIFEGCSLTLTQTIKGDDYTFITVSSIPFDHLSGASWKAETQQSSKKENGLDSTQTTIVPESFSSITLEASSNIITFKRKSTGSVPLPLDILPYEGRESTIQFTSDDSEMPARLVKAFNHAIQLCHVEAKPEPF